MKFRMEQKDRISKVIELQQDNRVTWNVMTLKEKKKWINKISTTSDQWHLDCYQSYLKAKHNQNQSEYGQRRRLSHFRKGLN